MLIEYKRLGKSGWFLAGILFTLFLCFFSNIITGEKNYTILQVVQKMSREEMKQEAQLYPPVALRNAFNGYVTLFVPIVSAISFVRTYHAETQSGYKRFYISRKKHFRYYMDKWIASALNGGCILLLAAILFHLFLFFMIPFPCIEESDTFGFMKENFFVSMGKVYLGIICYGVFSTLTTIFVSIFTNNIYFLVCIPFMLTYFWDICIADFSSFLRQHESAEWILNLINGLFSRSYLSIAESWEDFFLEIIRIVILIISLILMYELILKKRQDLGE